MVSTSQPLTPQRGGGLITTRAPEQPQGPASKWSAETPGFMKTHRLIKPWFHMEPHDRLEQQETCCAGLQSNDNSSSISPLGEEGCGEITSKSDAAVHLGIRCNANFLHNGCTGALSNQYIDCRKCVTETMKLPVLPR